MGFIDYAQRDILSIISDIGSILGWLSVGGYVGVSIFRNSLTGKSTSNFSSDTMLDQQNRKIELYHFFNLDWSSSKVSKKGKTENVSSFEVAQTEAKIRQEEKQ